MRRIKISSDKDIQEYSQFENYEEYKANMEIWLIDYQMKFTRGEMFGLNQLIQLASKVPGVCHESMKSIVRSTDIGLNEHAISRSTFKRMVWKCTEFNILTAYETENRYGSQCGNLYVFHPYPTF
ncbi:hypothetical protein DZB84_10350 [Bacillus sp. HNG]|uniref:hypothetical protein n=1 Tax=Bacillus sp. HNG TaxID=2293325 RepID=UPI000E2E6031|nr:hypothetical protein [Bacillus sp. HNG]RFB17455.1 hypothetical protein DZB84_10350 [Bacillus sp. HNG]